MSGVSTASPRRGLPAWTGLLLAAATIVTVAELSLLALGTGFFGVGFNSMALRSAWPLVGFALLSLLLDVGLVLVCWALLVGLLGRRALGGLRGAWILLTVSAGVPALLAAYRYNIYAIAGAMFSLELLRHTPLGSSSSMVQELLADGLVIWILPAALCVVAMGVATRLLGLVDRRHPDWAQRLRPPAWRACAVTGAGILLVTSLAIRLPFGGSDWLRFGLGQKSADWLSVTLLETLTDVDGDGFGPLSVMADPAPFDGAIHPYAVEVPGNRLDENGLAGDLPGSYEGDLPIRAPLPGPGPRPHLLVLYLESFREDLLGREVDGQPVTPFLNRLAAEGASTRFAFAHTAWTLDSRAQLFTGRIAPAPGESTLIDDFRALGYEVLHFSGQDESFGDSEAMLGVERADHFYDARQDLERRSSRSTAAVSLQVSWKVLAERIGERLDAYDGKRPLFVYANITDTHFPYVHDELDDILRVPPFDRSMIRSSRTDEVVRAYENNAANVDRGSQLIVERFREAIGGEDHGILVLADHGEAFYENGRLGHGLAVDDYETRIPFVVWGIGGEWPEPVAPSDVRGLLRRNLPLEREDPVPRFVARPERRLLQYAPSLERPRVIALRGVDGRAVLDLELDALRLERAGPDALPPVSSAGDGDPRRRELVWRWEAARQSAAGPQPD